MADLSPAAQAIDTALADCIQLSGEIIRARPLAAAALRAAADQVAPQLPMLVEGGRTYEEAWTATVHDAIRRQLLAIAAELEQSHIPTLPRVTK